MGKSTFVVFNPHSGKGRGAQFIRPVLELLGQGGPIAHGISEAQGDEARLTREALAAGHDTIVAVGGDGTWSNVGNAILSSGARARLGLVAGGTGCDLAKSLGIPRDLRAAIDVIRAGHARTIDAGRIEQRYFLNIAGFGYDVAVLEDSWSVSYLEGELLYLYCAIRQLRSFRGFHAEVAAAGGPPERRDLLMLIVANARVFGGGFKIAPAADLSDGLLDVVAFGNMKLFERVGIMRRLMRGTHVDSKHVHTSRAQSLELRFETTPTYETDGEWNRAESSTVTIQAVPAALEVLAPAATA